MERVRESWRVTESMEKAREDLREPGRGGEGQGGVERTMQKADEVQGRLERATKGWGWPEKVGEAREC